MLPIVRGITATRDVQDISDFAEHIRIRKSESESSRAKESERFNITHFNTQRLFTSKAPDPSQPIRRPTPSPLDQLLGTSKHIEKHFVNGTNWQDVLVPSVMMEAARRKHIIRLIEAGTFFPKEYPREADDQPTRVAPILLTRDGHMGPSALTERNGTQPETTVVCRDWRCIEAWRQRVAWEFGKWPTSNIDSNRERRRGGCGSLKDWRRSSPEPIRKDLQGTESKNENFGAVKGNAQVIVPVQGSGQFRPTKILSRKDELALAGLVLDPEGKEMESNGASEETQERWRRKLGRESERTVRKERTL